jgi:DNA repair protein RadA/Sms
MAANSKVVYVCRECGYETAKWMGKCPSCNAWGTLEEDVRMAKKTAKAVNLYSHSVSAKTLSEIDITTEERFVTGIKELDRVLGGGIVKGSGVLLSGDPGIGKSTILLQICNALQSKVNILYV